MRLMIFLASNNKAELAFFEKNLSLSNAIDGTHLKKMEVCIGEVNTVMAVSYLLNKFALSFNVGKSLNSTQSVQLASDILEKYPYETIEDIVLMLKMVRQGIIGDGKDFKLDGQNVLGKDKWMDQYLNKKYTEFERLKKLETDQFKKEQNSEQHPVSIFYQKQREKKAREEKRKKVELEIDNMVKSMDRQMLEDTIKDWELKNDEELNRFLPYLRSKRRVVKGDYRP